MSFGLAGFAELASLVDEVASLEDVDELESALALSVFPDSDFPLSPFEAPSPEDFFA